MKEHEDHVLVAVAINDVQAIVYRKLLEDRGIPVLLADFDDMIVGAEVILGKDIENVKILARARDADHAREVIREFESEKDTRITSKSGKHLMFRCPDCKKYICFPFMQRGSNQICPECLRIIELPER